MQNGKREKQSMLLANRDLQILTKLQQIGKRHGPHKESAPLQNVQKKRHTFI